MFGRLIAAMKKPSEENPQEWTLDNPSLEHSSVLINLLMQDQSFIFYALQQEILPTIQIERATLEIDSTQRAFLYRSIQGVSGTLDNHRSISQRIPLDSAQAIGTNGVTIGLIHKKSTVHVFTETKQRLVDTLFSQDSDQARIHSIIDAGGRFTGITNLDVAQHIAALLSAKDKTDPRKFVLFLNDRNELSAIDKNKPTDILFIGASDEKAIISKLGKGVTSENWTTYFSQRHTVGMDITQAPRAVAAITVAYDGTLSAFLQAAMRMRRLPNEQRLQIFIDETVAGYCQANHVTPTPEQVITFLSNNETTTLSDDHRRYVLAEMDNTLYQELLGYLLDSDDVMHQAEMLSKIQTHSQLLMKTTEFGLFRRYGRVENEEALDDLLTHKKTQLIHSRALILEMLQQSDCAVEPFQDTLTSLITLAKQICKPTVLARELCEEGNQVEAEAETAVNVNTQMETETALAVENVTERPSQQPRIYQEWLCEALTNRADASAWKIATQKACLSLPEMLHTTTNYPLQLHFNPNLLISMNHAIMRQEQQALFDESKMAFQYLFLRWHSGQLRTIVITSHEVEALLQKQASLFDPQHEESGIYWIESFPKGHLVIGSPPAVATNETYFILKEQLKFLNGDLKSLLSQDVYVWSVRQLTLKKYLLPTILASRPDQRRYVEPLLNRLITSGLHDENTALEALAAPQSSLDSREARLFEIASLRPLASTTRDQQCVLASTLIARFNASNFITSNFLLGIYPQLAQEQAEQLATLYALKQLLSQCQSLKPADQKQLEHHLQRLKKTLQKTSIELLRHVVTQAAAEADESLINASYYPGIHTTEILDGLPIDETHPVLSSLQQRHLPMCATILQHHFKSITKDASYNARWLENVFQSTLTQKNRTVMKMLLQNCGPTLALSQPLASDYLVFFAEVNEPELSSTLLLKMARMSYIPDLQALQTTCQKLTNCMLVMLKRDRDSSASPPELLSEHYLLNYPNFCLQTGTHQGYSQLMLACQLRQLHIAEQLFLATTPDNRAQETPLRHWNALTAALNEKNNPVAAYLITQHCRDFYSQISRDNMSVLLLSLSAQDDEEQIIQCLLDITQQVPPELWDKKAELTSTFFRVYSRLTQANKFMAAANLYDACQSHGVAFNRIECVDLMLSCLCISNASTTQQVLFLLTQFPSYSMDEGNIASGVGTRDRPSKSVPFINMYDNPTLRRACLSALHKDETKPILSKDFVKALLDKVIESLSIQDKVPVEENLQDAYSLIQLLQDKPFNTDLLNRIFYHSFRYATHIPCPSLDFLELLTKYCDQQPPFSLFYDFLTYVNESLKSTKADNWRDDLPRLTTLCCSLIPSDFASQTTALTYRTYDSDYECTIGSSSLACTEYLKQVPGAVESMLPLIQANLTNVAVKTQTGGRCNLLLHTLSQGPQVICDALLEKGARLSHTIGRTDESALNVLISDKKWQDPGVIDMDKVVSILNMEEGSLLDYLKQAIVCRNRTMVEALLRCKPITEKLKTLTQGDILQIFTTGLWYKPSYSNQLSLDTGRIKILTLACQLTIVNPSLIPQEVFESTSAPLADLIALLPKSNFKAKYWEHILSNNEAISEATSRAFVDRTDWKTLFTENPDSDENKALLSKFISLPPLQFQVYWEPIKGVQSPENLYDCLMDNLKSHYVAYENINTVYLSLCDALSQKNRQAFIGVLRTEITELEKSLQTWNDRLSKEVEGSPQARCSEQWIRSIQLSLERCRAMPCLQIIRDKTLPVDATTEAPPPQPTFHTKGLSIFKTGSDEHDDKPQQPTPKPK